MFAQCQHTILVIGYILILKPLWSSLNPLLHGYRVLGSTFSDKIFGKQKMEFPKVSVGFSRELTSFPEADGMLLSWSWVPYEQSAIYWILTQCFLFPWFKPIETRHMTFLVFCTLRFTVKSIRVLYDEYEFLHLLTLLLNCICAEHTSRIPASHPKTTLEYNHHRSIFES